jgi:signal transduction histidine kinase/ligand-binding sensor domain-containing protein
MHWGVAVASLRVGHSKNEPGCVVSSMSTHVSMPARRFKRGFRFCVALGVSMCSALGSLATAAERQSEASPLLEQSWAAGSDNRRESICALLQTRQGYLWIGTDKGLLRFDGVRFTDFPFATTAGMTQGSTVFNAMWEDNRGGIWAGTYAGLTHYDGRQFSSLTTRDGLASNSVLRVDGDETGAVWIYTRNGVSRWRDGTLEAAHPELDNPPAGPLITEFRSDSEDLAHLGLWRRGPSGLERFAYGRWTEFPLPFGGKRDESSQIRSVYEDSLHRVWYALSSDPTTYYEVTTSHSLVIHRGLPAQAFVFFRDRDGFLWISDHQSHTARWKDGVLYPVPSLRTPYLTHMIQRPDGGLWAGTFFNRLFLFRPRLITAIKTPGAQEVGPVLFRQRNGSVWAASTDLVRFEGQKAIREAALGGSTAFGIATAIGEDRYGDVLLGERFRSGVYALQGRKLARSPLYSAVSGNVWAILRDSAGDEWFGTSDGLFHEHAGETHRVSGGLPETQITCLLESAPGRLWVGTDNGPVVLSGETVDAFPYKSGWPPWNVSSMAKDPDGSIWISSSNRGIVHYADGKFRGFDRRDGLPTNVIYSMEAGDPKFIWLRTDTGLLRIGRDDLLQEPVNGTPAINIMQFDEADGLPMIEMTPPGNQGVLRFPDGTIWFSSQGGIASIRPDVLDRVSSRPHAVIEEHAIDSSNLRPSVPDGIVLMPDETNLEIRYTALGSSRPERVKFRHELVGIDDGWVPGRDGRASFYTHLPPGEYVFRVQATDGDESGWKEPQAQIRVTVRTPFYKTWWMKTLFLLTVLSAVAIAIELRRRHMLEIQRARQAFTHRLIASQETERKRIAHELHDGLGQHLALIRTLALLPARLRAARSAERVSGDVGTESLSSIADEAAAAIREVETICYALRPYQLDRLGLTKAVRSLLRTLEEGNVLVLRSSVDDIDGFFPRELEITFYRILQEGISNILKHSGATEAEIIVTCDRGKLRLTINDNGRGFSMASPEAGGESLGLVGIRERAEVLGGCATIESSEQDGTRIVVEVLRTQAAGSTEL